VQGGQTLATGSTVSTTEPTQAAVTPPTAGTVTITQDASIPDPSGYGVVGAQYQIDAPTATAADPLRISFDVSATSLPAGEDKDSITLFRDGTAIGPCTGAANTADPDPCVASRTQDGDTITITVLTSHASQWTLGVPTSATSTTLAATSSATYGASVTLSAHVTSSGNGVPAGSVFFSDTSTSPATALGSAPVTASGTATLSTTMLHAGVHHIVASYPGSTNTVASTSTSANTTINKAPLSIAPNAQTIAFGQPDPAFTYAVIGLVNGDGLTHAPSCGVAVAHTKVGTYTITCTGAAASSDYALTQSTAVFTVTLNVSTAGVPAGLIGHAYSGTLKTTGGTGTLHYAQANGVLPPGLKVSAAGAISGTPTAQGTFVAYIRVTDSATPTPHTVTVPVTITIGPMTITTATLPDGYVGKAYAGKVVGSGGRTPYVWTIAAGTLPAGLTLSTAGAISGTPTAIGTATFTVRLADASNPKNIATRVETITIHPMTITTANHPNGLVGKAYSGKVTELGGKPTVTWKVISGALPNGVTMSTAGAFAGTPSRAGSFTFTVRATDTTKPTANTVSGTFTITIAPMTITTTTLPAGTAHKYYSTTLKVNGGVSTKTWSVVSGTLPPGTKLSAAGALTGTPTTAGSYTFTVQVKDTAKPTQNFALATYSLTVS
jgi:hypothetical protein